MRAWPILILLIFIILIVPGSCTIWFEEHFISDNSANWAGDAEFTWVTGAPGWLNISTAFKQYYYKEEKFGTGWYNVTMDLTKPVGGGHWEPIIFGAQDLYTGRPDNTGTKYHVFPYDAAQLWLGKSVAGAYTDITGGAATVYGLHNYNISWDTTAGNIKVYLDGTLKINSNDNAITDPGYFGRGTMGVTSYGTDEMVYSNETAPPPTPTTSPTMTVPAERPGHLFYSGIYEDPGIITSIYLTLDKQPFLLIALIVLAYIALRRR